VSPEIGPNVFSENRTLVTSTATPPVTKACPTTSAAVSPPSGWLRLVMMSAALAVPVTPLSARATPRTATSNCRRVRMGYPLAAEVDSLTAAAVRGRGRDLAGGLMMVRVSGGQAARQAKNRVRHRFFTIRSGRHDDRGEPFGSVLSGVCPL